MEEVEKIARSPQGQITIVIALQLCLCFLHKFCNPVRALKHTLGLLRIGAQIIPQGFLYRCETGVDMKLDILNLELFVSLSRLNTHTHS